MKILISICLSFSFVFAAWVMFNDGEDTYIYNNNTGDIYVRHSKGGKNYEDVFVKMPSGILPNNLNAPKNDANIDKKGYNNNTQDLQDLTNNLQKMQQNMLDKALE